MRCGHALCLLAWSRCPAGSAHPMPRSAAAAGDLLLIRVLHRGLFPGWRLRPARTMYRWRPLRTAGFRWPPVLGRPTARRPAGDGQTGGPPRPCPPGWEAGQDLPSPVPASALHRLQGARTAINPLQAPHGPTLVQRRVSSQGGIQVAGQKLRVGKTHAGTTVTVLVADRHFEILDGQTPIKTIPRHCSREVTRYKADDSKPIRDQGCQASTEP